MTDGTGPRTIPARVTTSQLASIIGVELPAVQAVLAAQGEPDGPGDVLDAAVATQVAAVLGHVLDVETRDLALEALYEMDGRRPVSPEPGLPPKVQRLVSGVLSTTEHLDAQIEAASQHWSVARMPVIDRVILRMGLWELENQPDTPVAVVVSEAVRLANTYSTGRSGSFVNGVLATLAKSARTD